MMTDFTAFALKVIIENGGKAVKLGLFCTHSYKVAEKRVRERVRQEDGSMQMTDPIKQKRR